MGADHHYSGWPYVMRQLQPLQSDAGILLDDYVEGTFRGAGRGAHCRPWVGIFHHPPHYPPWYCPWDQLSTLFAQPDWQASRPHLKLAVALSQYQADWLARELGVPVVALRHPTQSPARRFSEKAFRRNHDKCVFQLGWYLRNTEALAQLPRPAGFRKVCVQLSNPSVALVREEVRRRDGRGRRRAHFDDVEVIGRVPNAEYDRLLAENVVFLELYDVSACNVVVECLVRGTPLVVNRHPALEEYLGRGYPLFYERFDDAPALLSIDRLIAGHRYLQTLDTAPLAGGFFRRRLAAVIDGLGAGAAGRPSAPA